MKMTGYDRRRRATSRAVEVFCAASVVLALVPLGLILFFVVRQGLTALGPAFFTQMPKPVGEPGGGWPTRWWAR